MKKITVLIFVFILLSCTKETEIEIPHTKPKLVAYSTIVPFTFPKPKPLGVTLESSSHIFDKSQNKIDDAVVMYFENDILKDTLKYINTLGIYSISNNISDYPKEGYKYSIKIYRDGFDTIYAETQIPQRVEVIDTSIIPISYIDETGSAFSEVSLTFKDPIDEVNFYEVCVSDIAFQYDTVSDFKALSTYDNIVTSESYYPSLISLDSQLPRSLLFSDKSINGEKYTLRFYYTPPQREDEKGRYVTDHYISIHLRNVTEDYYKFKTSMLEQSYHNREDMLYGMGEPVNIISNIQNGYGLFAGFNNHIVSCFIPYQLIDK